MFSRSFLIARLTALSDFGSARAISGIGRAGVDDKRSMIFPGVFPGVFGSVFRGVFGGVFRGVFSELFTEVFTEVCAEVCAEVFRGKE